MARRASALATIVILSFVLSLFRPRWGLSQGRDAFGSSLASRAFLLAAETPGLVAPTHPASSAETTPLQGPNTIEGTGFGSSGFSSFCGWAVSLSITGMVLTFTSRERRVRMRGAWRRAMSFSMNAFARWRSGGMVAQAVSPSSYAAALLNPPTLEFLCRQTYEEEDDSDDEFQRNVHNRRMQKTRSMPAMAGKFMPCISPSEVDEERMASTTRHEQTRHPPAPTLLQHRQVQCKGGTGTHSSKSDSDEMFSQLPTLQDLRRMFIVQAARAQCSKAAVKEAIATLNQSQRRYHVQFQENDATQIYDMLSKNGTERVSAHSFAVEMRQLLLALASCDQLSLPQLRSIMAAAFDRFDYNEDGVLSIGEFSAALRSFNIQLGQEETETLLRFLSLAPTERQDVSPVLEREDLTEAEGAKLTVEDQFLAAVNGVKEQLESSTGWNNAVKIAEKVTHCLQEPGSPRSQVKRLMNLGRTELASATEISLTLAWVSMVVLHHSQLHPDAAAFEQIGDALDDFTGAVRDVFQAMPMGPALLSGVLGLAKIQKDYVAMDVDEALLYARYFLPRGCSQSLFHKLLTMAGCHWGTVSAGLPVEGHGELRILVRGKAVRTHGGEKVELLPGAFLTSREEAVEDVTYMAWDMEKLNACIDSVKDLELKELAQKMLEEAACGEHEAPVRASDDGWFSPVGEALESQAKRRGLVSSSLCPECLCRILSKPNMSLREKLDQVHAWIVSSKHEICDSLEAAGDLAALFSLLSALSTHSATLSSENFSQLAPLLILLADVISKNCSGQSHEAQSSEDAET